MIKIGITGGIGSGKSIVAELMQVMKIPVYNADNAAKAILKTNPSVQDKLRILLGNAIFNDGELDKARMAFLIFNNQELLAQTNAIVHPAVFQDFEEWCERQQSDMVACESAIIFESNKFRYLDCVITVFTPIKIRMERAMLRDHATEEQVWSRMKNQMPEEEKVTLADYVLVNDGLQAIIPQLHQILIAIRSRFKSHSF